MPRGDKSKYTGKQKRKAEHIEDSYESRGVASDEAERRAWATVNKESGGGNKGGSGRGIPDTNIAAKKAASWAALHPRSDLRRHANPRQERPPRQPKPAPIIEH
jgi:plasmid stabilization system protein ParE